MISRDEVVEGATYKIMPPSLDASIYITINNAEVNGETRPIEMFINCRHLPSVGWVSALSRLTSAAFRNEGKFPFYLINELLDTYDADGGYIIPKSQGKRANSVVAHIGYVIKRHCESIGLVDKTVKVKQ